MFYDLLIFIFMSYIKPQPSTISAYIINVVYRTIPTSNHNEYRPHKLNAEVVYRTIPTSNHNSTGRYSSYARVVYRTIPTSNHNYDANKNELV